MVSVTGINYTNQLKNKNISFHGHKLAVNENNQKVYKFYLPKFSNENAQLHIRKFYQNNYGEIVTDNSKKEEIIDFQNKNVLEIDPQKYDIDEDTIIAYRFMIDGKPYNDISRTIYYNNLKYNIADKFSSNTFSHPMSIYHVLPNTIKPNIKNEDVTKKNAYGKEISYNEKNVRMNHFIKFDASIQNIIDNIDRIKDLGFRRILSTPLFGQDNLTSSGYWPVNPYQISNNLGTIKDYEKLQIKLFQNSMGYIADGAFTDEGLNGIHMLDILKHGKNSDFKYWFDIYNFPVKLGVLPDKNYAYENFDIKIINSPVLWSVNADGTLAENFGQKNPNYVPNKETYIQLYDKRLATLEQVNNNELIDTYDIKQTSVKYEISKWTDSVLPYHFPVDANELKNKAKLALSEHKKAKLTKKKVEAKEFLLSWENFEITNAKNSSGIQLLTGNKNLAKLRLTLPAIEKNILEDAGYTNYEINTILNNKKLALEQTREYIVSAGQFWTNKTSKIIREYIAKELTGAKTPDEFLTIIKDKANNNLLPQELRNITKAELELVLSDNYKNYNENTLPLSVEELLKEYPLEALEVNESLTSIFAKPNFKNFAEKHLYSDIMKKITVGILNSYSNKHNSIKNLYDPSSDELNDNYLNIVQLMSDDIARYLLIKSLIPNASLKQIVNYDKNSMDILYNISPESLGVSSKNPQEEIVQLISLMKYNLKKINKDDIEEITNYLLAKYKSIHDEQTKVANYIILKTEAGLNWRYDAAKDIADIENFLGDRVTTDEAWGDVRRFWSSFNQGVNAYNPHSYKILEITDSEMSYSDKIPTMQNQGELEMSIIDGSNSTTQSNYSYLFDLYQRYFTTAAEKWAAPKENALELIMDKFIFGWNGTPGFLYSGNKNNIVYSHAAVGNHDKQRIAHNFTINTTLAYRYPVGGDELNNIIDDLNNCKLHFLFFGDRNNLNDMPRINASDLSNKTVEFSPANIAKMAALSDSFYKALSQLNINGVNKDLILKNFTFAMQNLAHKNRSDSELFFVNNFEDNYDDILSELKNIDDVSFKIALSLYKQTHIEMLKPAVERVKELAKLMVALPGNPTWYAGDEFLELGGEEKAKNVYLQNRNRLHHEYLDDANYSELSSLQNYLKNIFNLRNDFELSSLVDGDTVILKSQGDDGYGSSVAGLYRYNDNDDSIILLHNRGHNSNRSNSRTVNFTIDEIDLSEGILYVKNMREHVGLPNSLLPVPNTRYVNALNTNETYIMHSDGKIRRENNDKINLTSAVTILKRINK